ncbi:MAG: Ger(x)C family spore germination protein, partial [Bacillota bacterium]|nr:Ger(x)C family spore germination protein [Bacillota bacterium]
MNKRIRKATCIFASAALCAFLCGCWDYHGVNEETVVFGVAIDKTKKGDYHLSYEILDLINTSKEKGVKTKMIESEGDTIFEAVRSAKKKLANRLYFGNTLAIVIN